MAEITATVSIFHNNPQRFPLQSFWKWCGLLTEGQTVWLRTRKFTSLTLRSFIFKRGLTFPSGMFCENLNIIIFKEHPGVCPEWSRSSLNGNYYCYFKREKQLLNNHKDYIPRPPWVSQFSSVLYETAEKVTSGDWFQYSLPHFPKSPLPHCFQRI